MTKIDTASLHYFAVPAFILEIDQDGRAVYAMVNQEWCDAAQRSATDAIGKTAQEIFGGSLGLTAYTHHMEVFRSGKKKTYDVMLPVSVQIHSVRTTLTPVSDDAGNVVQLVGVSIDRTSELKRAELQANVVTANADIESFISMAAHDLRSPMRHVQILADMLRENFEDRGDGKLRLIDLLEGVAIKATSLISDILAHAQAADAEGEQETFDVGQLSNDIFVVLDPLQQHRLQVKRQWICSDKTATHIALRNLYDNAIKHSGQRVAEISVEASQIAQDMLEFSVSDNGVGFNDPSIAFLDGGKFRTDSGFGLLGVRRLINARDGTIKADSLSDRPGSIIRFTLPGQLAPPPVN